MGTFKERPMHSCILNSFCLFVCFPHWVKWIDLSNLPSYFSFKIPRLSHGFQWLLLAATAVHLPIVYAMHTGQVLKLPLGMTIDNTVTLHEKQWSVLTTLYRKMLIFSWFHSNSKLGGGTNWWARQHFGGPTLCHALAPPLVWLSHRSRFFFPGTPHCCSILHETE